MDDDDFEEIESHVEVELDGEPADSEWLCDVCLGRFDTEERSGVIIDRTSVRDLPYRKTTQLKLCDRCASAVSVAQILTKAEQYECQHGVPAGEECGKCEALWSHLLGDICSEFSLRGK